MTQRDLDALGEKMERAGEGLRKATAECDAYDNLPVPLDARLPDVPNLEHVVATTCKYADEQLKRDVEASIAREYFEAHKIEIISARLLSRINALIESAAGYGRTSVSFDCPAYEVGPNLSTTEGRAIANVVKEALKAFEPEVHFMDPDPSALNRHALLRAEGNGFTYADAWYHHVCFRGWRVNLDWRDHVQKRLHG